ncbi:hypothetical protein BJ742DRAFT_260892 [Cladochytrium replicatum]|nr:hypothetical protein BJ742DRAFT_260892 [Cladochytrium replicatum]
MSEAHEILSGSGLLEKDIEARNFIARAPLLTQKKRKRGEKTPDAPIEVGAVPDDPMDVTNENTQDHDVVGEDVENQNEPPKGKTGQPRRRGKRGKGVSAQKNGGSMSEVGLRGQMNGGAGAVGKGTTVRQGIAGAAARASKPNGNGSVSASEVPRSSSSSRNIGGLEVVPYDDDGVNYDEEVWQDENISGDGSYGKEAANKARTATPSVDRLVQNRTIVKTYGRKTRAKKFIPAEDPNDPIAVSRTDRSGIPIVRTSNPARTPAFSPTTKKPEPKSIELDIDPDSGDESVSKAFQAMRERVKNKRARTPARTPTPHTPQRSGSDPEMPNQVDADALENFMSDADPESRILIQQMLKEEGMYRVEHMDVDDERAAVLGN